MKFRLAISLIIAIVFLNTEAQDVLRISCDFQGLGFEDFVAYVEAETAVSFYYKTEWIEGIEIDLSVENMELEEAMEKALLGTGLDFKFLPPDRMVILKERVPVTYFSYLTGENADVRALSDDDPNGKQTGRYMEVSKPEQILQTITVGDRDEGFSRSAARIRGRVRDVDSGEPVIGATMLVQETGKGSISDQNGIVNMSLRPGQYSVQFSFIGMETFNCRLEVYSDGDFRVDMQSTVIALNEVQIVGNHYRDINSTDVGVERLSMNSVKQMPLFMGENDVIKVSKLLPGITSAGEASVGVNVRGGSADQNIFYINRVPIYNTSHMFGFLSAFNSDIIQDFSVYKGNVPANYGGRLSSVFNIVTRKGNQKNFTAHAGISPVSAHMAVEGPIKKDVASFLVSGRTSYSDWMLNRMNDPLLRESNASFYDFSGALSITPNEKNDINAFYYQSSDQFAYGDISEYAYGNRGGSLVWKHSSSPAFSYTLTGAVSEYNFANVEKQEISDAYQHEYRLRHSEAVLEFAWVPALNHRIDFGVDLVHYNLNRGEVLPYGEQSLRVPVDLGEEQGLEGSVFLSDNITIFPWLSVTAGIRYSAYSMLGPNMVRHYEDGEPKTESTVTDTVYYGKNEPVTFQSGPEIRTAMNIKMGRNTSFKLSFSQMRQYLFMLSNTVTISPTDQWKLSDYHIKPPTGNQYTTGLYHIWSKIGLSGSIEVYYKDLKNVVDFRDGASFIGSRFTETAVLQGDQKAYGVELMLQKSTGRLNGWISYAYSRSWMQVKGDNEFESINRGDPYPSHYDRPHVLNVVGNYKLNRRFAFSSNVVYMSGRPVTTPSSLYFIGDFVYIDYYAKNQARVPDYFRIDASLTIEGNLKADKMFHSSWSLNVYNVLGKNNPQSIYFEPAENYLNGYSFSVIGVPIFTIAWNVKMGNYESK